MQSSSSSSSSPSFHLPSSSSSPPPPPSAASSSRQPYSIRGVTVQFPYAAYDSQQLYMEKVIAACQQSQHALLESPTGTGKCFARGTQLRLHNGDVIAVERIVGGELLMGDDGTARTVTPGSLTPHGSSGALYAITPHWDGAEPFTVNGDHILVLSNNARPWLRLQPARQGRAPLWLANWFELDTANVMRLRQRAYASAERAMDEVEKLTADWAPLEWEVSVREFLAAPHDVRRVCQLMAADAVTFVNPQLPGLAHVLSVVLGQLPTPAQIDWAAWYLGMWMTGGIAGSASVSQGGPPQGQRGSHWEIIAELRRYQLLFNEPVTQQLDRLSTAGHPVYYFHFGQRSIHGGCTASIAHRLLQQYGLINNQHVPQSWICDTLHVRRRIFAGIVDGNGYRAMEEDNCYDVSTKELRVAQGFKLLGASLGLRTGAIRRTASTDKWTGAQYDGHHQLFSGHVHTVSQHVVCSYKKSPQPGAADYRAPSKDSRCYGFTVTQQPVGEYFGFAVHGGPNRRFLLADFTITHNTAALLCAVLAWSSHHVQKMQTQLAQQQRETAATAGQQTVITSQQQQQMMHSAVRAHESAQQSSQPALPPAAAVPPARSRPPSQSAAKSQTASVSSSPASASSPVPPASAAAVSASNGDAASSGGSAFVRPRIIYSSRTHSQLSKVVQELKRTAYRPRMALLGSRQQLCVHADVSRLSGLAQNHACHTLVNSHGCSYYEKLSQQLQQRKAGSAPLLPALESCMDLEDLLRFGTDHGVCPYFATREMLSESELVLMPYQYLVDPPIREALQLNLQQAVVIFDEAHNLESVCLDSASFDLSALDIAAAITEVQRCIEEAAAAKEQNRQQQFDDPWANRHATSPAAASAAGTAEEGNSGGVPELASLGVLKGLLLELEQLLSKHIIRDPEKGETRSGDYIFNLLDQCHINDISSVVLLQLLDNSVDFLLRCDDASYASAGSSSAASRRRSSSALSKLAAALRLVFAGGPQRCREVARDYRVHVHQKVTKRKAWTAGGSREQSSGNSRKPQLGSNGRLFHRAAVGSTSSKRGYEDEEQQEEGEDGSVSSSASFSQHLVLSYWCFNPGVSMASLADCGVRSFILTSGTLSPLDSFASEFQLSFPIRLESGHIIAAHQCSLSVLERGPAGHQLLSTYSNRSNALYTADLGNAIVNFCRLVPDGLLVFFPSYSVLDSSRRDWEQSGVMQRIRAMKHTVFEPRVSSDFAAAISEYQTAIAGCRRRQSRAGEEVGLTGAVFFAVCRGKVSEGLDFADANGRAVVITGLPYPALHEPRIRIKREFLDQQRHIAAQAAASSSSSPSPSSALSSPSSSSLLLTGNAWYQQQAARAVNQAIGRVIRHAADYGAILLCDSRFSSPQQQQQLSAWLRGRVIVHRQFASIVQPLRTFFKKLEAETEERSSSSSGRQPADEQKDSNRRRAAMQPLTLDAATVGDKRKTSTAEQDDVRKRLNQQTFDAMLAGLTDPSPAAADGDSASSVSFRTEMRTGNTRSAAPPSLFSALHKGAASTLSAADAAASSSVIVQRQRSAGGGGSANIRHRPGDNASRLAR